MAYLRVDDAGLLQDIASREEFAAPSPSDSDLGDTFWHPGGEIPAEFRLHGAQLFAKNYHNPHTPYSRLLLMWAPGTGKTIGALSVAKKYINEFRARKHTSPEHRPSVFVIGFTKAVIQSEMLRNPGLGFVTQAEVTERQRLYALAQGGPSTSPEFRKYAGYVGMLQRKLVDRAREGYFQFFGYKEFALRLFIQTTKGANEDFSVADLFVHSDTREEFVDAMGRAEQAGLVRVNAALITSLRQGLIIADEIHVVYNTRDRNMYGIALQYALDSLPPDDAPRALFMSATPVTGSATEIVDLLNLLVPRAHLPDQRPVRTSDLFASYTPPTFKPHAHALIERLTTGRVCLASNTDTSEYPDVLWEGEGDPEVPFIKLIKCTYSREHLSAIRVEGGRPFNRDFAYPNPDPPPSHTLNADKVLAGDAKWLQKQGIQTVGDSQLGGPFLAAQLSVCSAKYHAFVTRLRAYLSAGDSGKVLAFHMYARGAGVNLIAQILVSNGFALYGTPSTIHTICAICGVARQKHSKRHAYRPATVAVVSSSLPATVIDQLRNKFNSSENMNGEVIKVFLGSRIILQSLNFLGVRIQVTLAIPYDIESLIQLHGRSRRRGGHSMLPPEKRNVTHWVFVLEDPSGEIPDELGVYRYKAKEFAPIQAIMETLARSAVNAFAVDFPETPQLGSVSVVPLVRPPASLQKATYFAYGAVHDRINIITQLVKKALSHSPVWKYADLEAWLALPDPELLPLVMSMVTKQPNKTVMVKEGRKYSLISPQVRRGEQGRRIAMAGEYVLAVPVDSSNRPLLYTECYVRNREINKLRAFSTRKYIENTHASAIFKTQVQRYMDSGAGDEFLVTLPAAFHYSLMKAIVEQTASLREAGKRAGAVYRGFRMLVARKQVRKLVGPGSGDDIVGYVGGQDVHLRVGSKWIAASKEEAGIEVRQRENTIAVGYTEDHVRGVRFKLRDPVQKIAQADLRDTRSLAKGAVCSTRAKADQIDLLAKLRVSETTDKRSRCDLIRDALLAREKEARRTNGVRWFYLFNDVMPDLKV